MKHYRIHLKTPRVYAGRTLSSWRRAYIDAPARGVPVLVLYLGDDGNVGTVWPWSSLQVALNRNMLSELFLSGEDAPAHMKSCGTCGGNGGWQPPFG